MKRYFTILAALVLGVCASAQSVIKFSETAAKGTLDGKTFESNGMVLTVTDSNTDTSKRKVLVDANSCSFGTPGNSDQYSYRLKTGGKSDSKNNLTLTVPEDGTLYIAVRPGSSTATDRNFVLTQGGEEILNEIALDSSAKDETFTNAEGTEATRKVYPYFSCEVKAGDIAITYPVNAVNFYAFILETSGSTPIANINADAIPAGKAIKTIENGKVIVIRDGVKYNMNGAVVK